MCIEIMSKCSRMCVCKGVRGEREQLGTYKSTELYCATTDEQSP